MKRSRANLATRRPIRLALGASEFGPLRPFMFTRVLGRLRGIRPAGRSAALMSSGSGCARPSPFTSLRSTPRRPDPVGIGCSTAARHPGPPPRAPGTRHSEVKEEGWAQPCPGDMSGGGCPVPLARTALESASATPPTWNMNGRNGPKTGARARYCSPDSMHACATELRT